jgi:hypothetical protein
MIQPKSIPKDFEHKILMVVFLSTYIIPVFFLFILKRRKTIDDFHLKTIKERRFPILFFTILTLLLGFRLLELNVINLLAYSFISSALALTIVFILLFMKLKTSLHTIAIGGLIGFLMVISYHYEIRLLILLLVFFLLFGIIATARLKLKAHTTTEVYLGFLIGVISQFLVYGYFVVFYI